MVVVTCNVSSYSGSVDIVSSDKMTKSTCLPTSIEPFVSCSKCCQAGQIVISFSAVMTSTRCAGPTVWSRCQPPNRTCASGNVIDRPLGIARRQPDLRAGTALWIKTGLRSTLPCFCVAYAIAARNISDAPSPFEGAMIWILLTNPQSIASTTWSIVAAQ